MGEKHTPLSAAEARALVERIRKGVELLRALLLELHDREGWRALGYESWQACVVGEFGQSKTHLYRQLMAAKVEKRLREAESRGEISPMGESPLPERTLREVAKAPPEDQSTVYQIAVEESGGRRPTGRVVKEVVEEVHSPMGESSNHASQRPVSVGGNATQRPLPKKSDTLDDTPKMITGTPRRSPFDMALDAVNSTIVLLNTLSLKDKSLLKTKVELSEAYAVLKAYSPTGVLIDLPDWIDRELWHQLIILRGRQDKHLTAYGAKRMIDKLARLREEGHDANDLINLRIERGWRDFYPETEQDNGSKTSTSPTYFGRADTDEERERIMRAAFGEVD